jgi:hypothetical protein
VAALKHGTEVAREVLPQTVGDIEFVQVVQEDLVDLDPYGDSKKVAVDKPVNVMQLQDEITEATGVNVSLSLIWPEGADKGTLFVSPGGALDGRTLAGKIRSHSPDELYGLTEADRAQAQVMDKVRSGKTLTDAERDMALLALSRRGR